MADSASEAGVKNIWRRAVFPVLTAMALILVGPLCVRDELFQLLWSLGSGVVALVIWFFVDRYVSRRQR